MTPEQVKLVKDSFRKVLPIAGIAADLFYDRLFEIAPDIRPLFRDDLVVQKKKLMAMLSTVVNNLHQVDKIAPSVGDLGKRHVGYGVSAKHFAPVGTALLWTFGEILGADFAPSVKTAWTEAYVTLAGIMSGVVVEDMPQFKYKPKTPIMYDRPRCPKCTRQMYLAHIKPGKPGFDLRTFSCPKCEHSESILVKNG